MNQRHNKGGGQYAAYIRVSTTKQGERGVSLQEQREAISRYALRSGITIAHWYEEQETAAKRGRPVFSQMVRKLRNGTYRGALIHKIDRSARNLRDWAELGQLIDGGIEIHFCHESIDLNSRGGRLSADIQAVVAADFIRNLRDETRKGVYGRLKQGLYPFRAPIGYRDCGGGKPKEPDPEKAPLIRWAFSRYASGQVGFHQLLKELTDRGLRNLNGKPLSINGISTILNNPFYTGRIRIYRTGETFMGSHEPLISVSLYEEVQHRLTGRRQHQGLRHELLFRRLFVCRLCGTSLIGEIAKGHVYYRCHTRDCPTKGFREERIDGMISSALSSIALTSDECSMLEELIAKVHTDQCRNQVEIVGALEMKLGHIQQRLDRLTDAFVDGLIDQELFLERKERLVRDQRVIQEQKLAIRVNPGSIATRFRTFLELSKTAYLSYENGNSFRKREIVEMLTSNRWAERKNLAVELRFPFFEIAKWRSFTLGDPNRDASRIFFEGPFVEKLRDVPEVPEQPEVS